MNHHVLWSAVALYRGRTLTLEQAARHAGVSRARMATALRRHGVSLDAGSEDATQSLGATPDEPLTRSVNAD